MTSACLLQIAAHVRFEIPSMTLIFQAVLPLADQAKHSYSLGVSATPPTSPHGHKSIINVLK